MMLFTLLIANICLCAYQPPQASRRTSVMPSLRTMFYVQRAAQCWTQTHHEEVDCPQEFDDITLQMKAENIAVNLLTTHLPNTFSDINRIVTVTAQISCALPDVLHHIFDTPTPIKCSGDVPCSIKIKKLTGVLSHDNEAFVFGSNLPLSDKPMHASFQATWKDLGEGLRGNVLSSKIIIPEAPNDTLFITQTPAYSAHHLPLVADPKTFFDIGALHKAPSVITLRAEIEFLDQ